MLKPLIAFVLIAAPGAALAQAQSPAAPPATRPSAADPYQAAVLSKSIAFSQCVMRAMLELEENVSPETGAEQIHAGCASEKAQMVEATEAMIASLPEEAQAEARAAMQAQMAEQKSELVEDIRRRRLVLASPPGQAPPDPRPMNPLEEATEMEERAHSECVLAAIPRVPAGVTAQAGAAQVLQGCDEEWQAVLFAVDGWIEILPEEHKPAIRTFMRDGMVERVARMTTEIAGQIERQRAAAAAPAQ